MVCPVSLAFTCDLELVAIVHGTLGSRSHWLHCYQQNTLQNVPIHRVPRVVGVDETTSHAAGTQLAGVLIHVLGSRICGKTSTMVVEKTADLLQNM